MNKMIDTIKDVHQNYVCMYKVGTFYHVYNKDAYIVLNCSYLAMERMLKKELILKII